MNKKLAEKYIEFADKIYLKNFQSEDRNNKMISPYSILTFLAMLCEAAESDSLAEIKRLLGNDWEDGELRAALKNLSSLLRNCPGVSFGDANAFVMKELYASEVKKEFVNVLREEYGAEIFVSSGDKDKLNAWVDEKTKGMIKRAIDNEPDFSLINVIAFAAEWEEQYEEDDAIEEIFTNAAGKEEEVIMLISNEDGFLEDKELLGFVKSYKGGEFDFGMDMSETLQELGVKKIFHPTAADMSGMIDVPEIFVEQIIHKTHIEIDCVGTKAAAMTEAVCCACAPDFDRRNITLDRPFTFAIIHRKTELPVFVGKVKSVNPV